MFDDHANLAASTVATAPSPASSGVSLVLAAGDGTKFPAVPFNATVCPAASSATSANAEIVRVTGLSTDTLTIARSQEGTSARTILVGDQFFAASTKKTLTDLEASPKLIDRAYAMPANASMYVSDGLEISTAGCFEIPATCVLEIA